MEAIKCPNCGHGKTQQLSEEKYYCPACATEFLVHDRSKEFQETDEHIEKVHRDLKNAINSIVFSSGTSERDERFDNAFHLIEIGKYEAAQKEFDSLCEKCSNNYKSWWGEILLLTKNFTDMSENNVCSEEMVLYINNMRGTKNYSQEIEEILVQNLEEYFSSARTETEGQLENLKNRLERKNAKFQQLNDEHGKMFRKQGELQGIVNQENIRKEQAKSRSNAIRKFISVVIILLVEAKLISFFYKWVMKSVQAITEPLPDASDPSAGSAFGHATLQFFAIPLKAVLGIVVVVVVFCLLKAIFDALREGALGSIESKMVAHLPELDEVSGQESDLQNGLDKITSDIKSYTREKKEMEARLAFYDSVDCQRPDTFLAWDASSFSDRVMDANPDANEESSQQNADDVNMENEAGKKAAFCPNCGMQVIDDGPFCHACGSPL